MNATVGQHFKIPGLGLTASVTHAGETGALVELAFETRSAICGVGTLAAQYSPQSDRCVGVLLSMPTEYHQLEKIEAIRQAVFEALDIPPQDTWQVTVCSARPGLEVLSEPRDGVIEFFGG